MTDSDVDNTAAVPDSRPVLTVSELNRRVRQLLETHFPLLWVEGELSNLARPSSGHWYFTLKDGDAQVRCAMFRNRNQRLRLQPRDGMQLLVRARVGLYEGRGEYQLIVEHMEEAGLGALMRAFEALKAQLAAEGLFAPERKRALPWPPRHLGVITSATGAALRDILSVLARRYPLLPVTVLPVPVQGADAAPAIVAALERAKRWGQCDLLIVGRGGGSLEDLWPFNEEAVARAIAASAIPVVSAVGHEVDFTISDFVADVRAPTPSAAAELISPDGEELRQALAGYHQLLAQQLQRRLQRDRQRLHALGKRLRHPGERLRQQAQHLDQLELRLRGAMTATLRHQRAELKTLRAQLGRFHPELWLGRYREHLRSLQRRLRRAGDQLLPARRQQLQRLQQLLHTLGPEATLARGYSISFTASGEIVRDSSQVQLGDALRTRLHRGEVISTVDRLDPDEP